MSSQKAEKASMMDFAKEGTEQISKGVAEYVTEFWTICQVVSQAVSCYLSNSLLFVTILPENKGPDQFTVFLGKAFQIAAAVMFVFAIASHGIVFAFAGLIVAMLLPFTQDIRVSLPGFSSSATLFLPTAAMLASIVPYQVALFALSYFTVSSLAGLAPSMEAKEAPTAAQEAAKAGLKKAQAAEVEQKKKKIAAKLQSIASEISTQESRLVKAKGIYTERDDDPSKQAYEKAQSAMDKLLAKEESLEADLENLSPMEEGVAILPSVNLLNHPLLPYQLGLVPVFVFGTGMLNMVKSTMCEKVLNEAEEVIDCKITYAGLVSLSVTLSIFSVGLVMGLYFGVSSYSLVFSLPKPEYKGGKWTPFRGGMGKVTQEIVLNIVNMNLMFWIMWFLSESDLCQPLRNVLADIIAASLETLEGEDYQQSEFAAQKEHIDTVKSMEEMVLQATGEVSKDEFLLPAIIFCTVAMAGGGFFVWHKFKVAAELNELQKSKHFKKEMQKVSGGKLGKEDKKKK